MSSFAEHTRRGYVFSVCAALLSAPLVSMVACASNEEAPPAQADADVLPGVDASSDGSVSDAATDADGDAGSRVPCAVGNLCSVETPLAIGHVVTIAGRGAADVWASGSRGLLMRWDGQRWSDVDATFDESLTSLVLTDDEVWGASGTLVMRRGLEPSSVRTLRVDEFNRYVSGIALLAGEPYVSIGAPSAEATTTNFLAKLTFDTRAMEFLPDPVLPGTSQPLPMSVRALHLVPNEALWLVGDSGRVARYPIMPPAGEAGPSIGAGLIVPVASQANLRAAWGYGADLWAVGAAGAILHFDGARWTDDESTTSATLNAVFGFSPSDIWAVGDAGTALHFDGTSWQRVDVGAYAGSLRSVWGAAPDDVWIGGERTMFHWGALP